MKRPTKLNQRRYRARGTTSRRLNVRVDERIARQLERDADRQGKSQAALVEAMLEERYSRG